MLRCCVKRRKSIKPIGDPRPKAKILSSFPQVVGGPDKPQEEKPPEKKILNLQEQHEAGQGYHVKRSVAKRKTNGGTSYEIQILRKQTIEQPRAPSEEDKPEEEPPKPLAKPQIATVRVPQNRPKMPVKRMLKPPLKSKPEIIDWKPEPKPTESEDKRLSLIPPASINSAEGTRSERHTIAEMLDIDMNKKKLAKKLPSFNEDDESVLGEEKAPDYLSPDKQLGDPVRDAWHRNSMKDLTKVRGATKSLSPSKGSRQGGYRTLNYKDLLSNNFPMKKSTYEDALSSKFSSHDTLGPAPFQQNGIDRSQSRSNSGSQGAGSFRGTSHRNSVVVNEGDAINDINKTEYSNLDFSILESSSDLNVVSSSRTKPPSKMAIEARKVTTTRTLEEAPDNERGEDKTFNKDLRTTYVRSSELNARK